MHNIEISQDNLLSKYQNKFFPKRNIPSKLKNVQVLSRKGVRNQHLIKTKGHIIEKENSNENSNNNAILMNNITNSVPTGVPIKLASSSLMKATPSKNKYFSPNWKYTPYNNSNTHQAPVYK